MSTDLLAASIGKMWPVLVLAAAAGGTIYEVRDMGESVKAMAHHQTEPGHPVAMENLKHIEETVEKNSTKLDEQQVMLVRLCAAVGC